ncbi:conjugal transfer protein [Citrobacter freundii]|uniref:type 4 pilus major pilin n=1 Tax=Citrobacter freundii TaxID=546 RepID=UPI0019084A92|nr:type 4 pilus major pilin [Citrobacter freundii]MBJ9635488.1 conjugal transfer protein [Citrobacter freundii]
MKAIKNGIIDTTDINMGMVVRFFIIVLVITAASVAFFKSRALSDVNLANAIINEMRNQRDSSGYQSSTDYSASIIKSGALPSNATVRNNQIYNQAGQPIQIVGNGVGFKLTESGLSDKECMNLAVKIGSGDMLSTQINGQTYTAEVTALNANTSCSGNNNTITFNTRF